MIIKYFSHVDPQILLGIHNTDTFKNNTERLNISPDNEILQLAKLCVDKGKTYRPHSHIQHPRKTYETQECWIVLKGTVTVSLFDLDKKHIENIKLLPGEAFITFGGGHGYKIEEDNTQLYEIKNGPYSGQKSDKEFINDLQ